MKKLVSKLILVFVSSFLFVGVANAASTCTASRQNELNAIANNIKTSILTEDRIAKVPNQADDEDEPTMIDMEYTTFVVQLTNLTKDVYVTIKDEATSKSTTYSAADFVDGELTFEVVDPYVSTTYKINIYSNDSNCKGDLLRVIDLTTPQVNEYHYLGMCVGAESFYLCQKVINSSVNLSESQIINGISNYKKGLIDAEGNEIPAKNGTGSFKLVHLIIIFCTIGLVIGGYFVVKYVQRRRSII